MFEYRHAIAPSGQRVRRIVVWLLVAATATVALGCNQLDSDPVTLIKDFRLVAVRADPPFIAGPGVPGTTFGSPTTFTPLVIDRSETGKLCYAWRLCPFAWTKDGNYRCLDPLLEVDLGTGPTAKATALDVFKSLEKAEEVAEKIGLNIGPSQDAEGKDTGLGEQVESALGLQVSVLFMFGKPEVWGGTCPKTSAEMLNDVCPTRSGCIQGYTKIALATSPKQLNTSPGIDGMTLDGVDWPAHVTPTIRPLDKQPAAGPNPDAKNLGVGMAPVFDKSIVELIKPAGNGQPDVFEEIRFSWYGDNGTFRYNKTSQRVWENRFMAAKPGEDHDDEVGKERVAAKIWVVARDNRNGVDWAMRNIFVDIKAPENTHPLCSIDPKLDGCDTIDPATGKPKADD